MASAVHAGTAAYYRGAVPPAAARCASLLRALSPPRCNDSLFRAEDWAVEIKLSRDVPDAEIFGAYTYDAAQDALDSSAGAGAYVDPLEYDLAALAVAQRDEELRRDMKRLATDPALARAALLQPAVSENMSPGGGDDEVSDGDSFLHGVDLSTGGARTTNGGVVTSTAPQLAQAAPTAAPSQRPQRTCVLKRADLAAAPLPPPVAAAPVPSVARQPRALAPKPAGIAKKAKAPKPPVSGLFGGSATCSIALKKELLRALPKFPGTVSRKNKHGKDWASFNVCVMDTNKYPLWKARIRGKESRVATRLYGRMVASGELERLLAEIKRRG